MLTPPSEPPGVTADREGAAETARGSSQEPARWLVTAAGVALVLGAAAVFGALWVPMVFALWTAALLTPLHRWLEARLGGRTAAATVLELVAVMSLLVPLVFLVLLVGTEAAGFVRRIVASPAAQVALEAMVSADPTQSPPSPVSGAIAMLPAALQRLGAPVIERVAALLSEHGATAWRWAASAAGAGASLTLDFVIFAVTLFAVRTEGDAAWAWARAHVPLGPETLDRLARAFTETGRGIFIGAGLTSLAQSLLSMLFYAALGVPRVVVLGLLTFVAAFVPAVGTAVVWGPVALGLALTGHPGKALALALLGAFGVGSIDNLTRPLFQRWGGNLKLPASVLLFAAFGGLSLFGAKGLLLGPLLVRMAREVIEIARPAPPSTPPG